MRFIASCAVVLLGAALFAQALHVKPGDKLRVACPQESGLNGEYTVSADGMVQLPFLGVVEVAGLEPAGVAARVEGLLRSERIVTDPKVTVEIVGAPLVPVVPPAKEQGPKKEAPQKPVTQPARARLVGAVESPIDVELAAGMTLADLLARGKPTAKADLGAVLLTRVGGIALSYDCREGAPPVPLQAGDTVEVSELKEPQTVTVLGAVGTPGGVEFYPGLTVLDAVERCGGVTPGTEGPVVTLVRNGERTRLEWPEGARSTTLRADDAVEVLAFGAQGTIAVEGAVRRPGFYTVGENTTLGSLLRSAGGADRGSDLTKVAVLRSGEKKPSYYDYLAIEQGMRGDVRLRSGDRVYVEGPGKKRYGPSAAAGLVGIAWLIFGR